MVIIGRDPADCHGQGMQLELNTSNGQWSISVPRSQKLRKLGDCCHQAVSRLPTS